MINIEFQLKLQAWLDGELPAGEARATADWLATDAEARALRDELEGTKRALAGGELQRTLPETREFYWSKIVREIERQDRTEAGSKRHSLHPWWRRLLVPAAGLAALAFLLSLNLGLFPFAGRSHLVETTLDDSGAFTYRDHKEGITLVWLSYPAKSNRAADEEEDIFD